MGVVGGGGGWGGGMGRAQLLNDGQSPFLSSVALFSIHIFWLNLICRGLIPKPRGGWSVHVGPTPIFGWFFFLRLYWQHFKCLSLNGLFFVP